MRTKTMAALGGVQSIVFCTGIYLVALFFSIFICSAVFNVIHPKRDTPENNLAAKPPIVKQVLAAAN